MRGEGAASVRGRGAASVWGEGEQLMCEREREQLV